MRQELIESIHSFENFVEKMDEFVYKIKSDNELNDLDMDLNHYDLRTKDGDIFPLPSDLSDFFPLFECVIENAEKFFYEEDPEKKELMANEMFFDLYWNDRIDNSAYYQDYVFWVTFNDDKTLQFY
jgi:hypothetical protein